MPFIPDTAEAPTTGRFIPDGDESPLTPDEQSDAEHRSDIAAAGKLTRPERLSGNVASFLDATEALTSSMHRPIAQVRKGVAGIATNIGIFTPDEFQAKVEAIDNPAPLIPSVPPQEGTPAKVGAGVANGIIDFVNGMADPDAAMQLGVAAVPSAGRKALLTLFAVSMAKEAPEQFEAGVEAVRRGDTQEAARHFTGGTGSTILPLLMAKHANATPKPSLPDRAAKSEMLSKALDASDLKVADEAGTVAVPREAGPLRPGDVFKSDLPNVAEASPELKALAPQTAAVVDGKAPMSISSTSLEAEKMNIPAEPAKLTTPDAKLDLEPAKADVRTDNVGLNEPLPAETPAGPEAVLPDSAATKEVTPPEMTGMGAAVPGEFSPARQTATGIKNAAVDAERQARGQTPITAPHRLSNPVVWDRTMAKIDTDPAWQDRLIEELKEKPRTPDQDEIVALDHRYVDLQNEYAKATRDGAQAYKDGHTQGVEEARARSAFFENKLSELEQVARTVGTEWGRSGQMRQRLLKEDYTLAAMEAKARAAKGFEPLTEAEHAQVADLHAKLEAAEKAAAEAQSASQTRIANLEIEKSLAEARAGATEPAYEPRVLQAAEKFAKFMDKKGEDALARIKARLGRTSAGIDPTILSDVGILGAAKLTRGIVDFAKWTDAMTRDLGDWFKEHAQEAWDASQKVFASENENFHKGVDKTIAPKVKKALADLPGRIADVSETIKGKAQGEGSPIHTEVRKLVRLLVEQDPKITRDGLIDTVHGVLMESMPEITRLEAMDAISGRGKFWTPSQDAVSKTVRDLSTQIRLVGHQIDVEAGRPLPRTGYQPEKLTDAARREQQKLNDLKRRHGVVITDPTAQLGSALAARKTYYTHRIADLKSEIEARERIVKNRSLPPTDPALEALKLEYEKVKSEHAEIFGGRDLTDAQRLKLAVSAAERNAADWAERLERAKTGNFDKAQPARKVSSNELEAIKARTEAVKAEFEELHELAFPKKTPEQIALQSLKTRLATEKAQLQERLAKGDFSPRRKSREIPLDTPTAAAKAEVAALRNQYGKRLAQYRYEQKTRMEKIWHGIKQVPSAIVNVASSFDFSAPRQALIAILSNTTRLITHPVRGAGMLARPLGKMFAAWASERRAGIIEQKIKNRPNAKSGADKAAGIEFTELTTDSFSRYEENAHSILDDWASLPFKTGNLAKTVATAPAKAFSRGVRMSNRAFITFLNSTRAELFDELLRVNFKDTAPTALDLKIIGNAVNVATGRGKLGHKTASVASSILWSPKLLASRFQAITGQPLLTGAFSGDLKGSAKARTIVAKEYGRAIAGGFLLFQVSRLFDDKKEENLTSSDYGKIVRGDTRIDPWGGLQQVTTFSARAGSGITTTLDGKEKKSDLGTLILNFARSKLRPDLGSIWDAYDLQFHQVKPGHPQSIGEVAGNLVIPLSLRDVVQVMEEHGFTEGMIIEALGQFGAGVSHYEEKEAQR